MIATSWWDAGAVARRRHAVGTSALVLLLALAMAAAPSGPAFWLPYLVAAAVGLWLPGWEARPRRAFWTAMTVFLLFVFVANALWNPGTPVSFAGRTWPLTQEGVAYGLQTAARLPAILLLFRGWFLAVDAWEVAQAVAAGLRRLALPPAWAEEAALALHLALRAVPAFAVECRRLTLQRALRRGWPGPGTKPRERARRLRLRLSDWPPVLIPLVLLALHRAEEVSLALAARHTGAATVTPRQGRPLVASEWAVLGAASVLLAVTLMLRWAA